MVELKSVSASRLVLGLVLLSVLAFAVMYRVSGGDESAPLRPAYVGKPIPSSAVHGGVSKEQEHSGPGQAATLGLRSNAPLITIPPEFDFSKYPNGLKSAVDEILETRQSGRLAFELASILRKCRGAESRMEAIQQALPTVKDLRLSKYYEAGYVELQKLTAQCQALGSDIGSTRIKLLELARQAKVESSAAELYTEGVADPQVLASIVQDARGGDLSSILQVATSGRGVEQFTGAQVSINRYVLLLALNDATTRGHVAPLVVEVQRLSVARGLAPGQAGELDSRLRAALEAKTDVISLSGTALDEAGKREAAATLQRLISKEASW